MYIYVATSWRNGWQPKVVKDLRDDGHEVYDFRGEEGFSWSEVDKAWEKWTPQQYLVGLNHECAERGFKRDMDALKKCDACVYVMPCGPSASMEMGYAAGAGKLVIVYIPALREPDLMVKMAHLVTDNFEEVRERLIEYSVVKPSRP
jgi:nucleoside 2-deoxyribosyltransferase